MYKERMFDTWKKGLIHLVIVFALPIFPIIIYMITENRRDSYLYILLLTVIVSLLYEFFNFPHNGCSIFLMIENIICCTSLIIMLVWDIFELLLVHETGSNAAAALEVSDILLISMFDVPIAVVIIEIVRCVIFDIKSSKFVIAKNNLKGASDV